MVVKSLATVISNRDQLPYLRASLESPDARPFAPHLPGQIHPLSRTNHDEVGFAGYRGHDDALLAQWVCLARRFFKR